MTTINIILLIIGWLGCGFFTALYDAKIDKSIYSIKDLVIACLLGLIFLLWALLENGKFWNKKVFTILLLIGGLGLSSCKPSVMHYEQFKNVQITEAYNWNNVYVKVHYWDFIDTTKKTCLIDKIYEDSLIVGKKY